MRRITVVAGRQASLPRGWTVVLLALAAWALLIVVVQMGSNLFSYIASSL